MSEAAEKPRLRQLEAFPIDAGGGRVVCLRDPMNISTRVIGVPPAAGFILSLLNGERTPQDIQVEFLRRTGQILPTPDLEQLLSDLDESLMLDSRRFRDTLAELEREWTASPLRTPTHLGGGYEADPDRLDCALSGYFTHPDGPGPSPTCPTPRSGLRAIIAPHIDYDRGGPTYAWAYREIARDAADVYVVLGTSHTPLSTVFSVTRKHFATPFGPVHTDTAFIDLLEEKAGRCLENDFLVHRSEHSIELQTVWLRHLLGERARIVPILCGSLGGQVLDGTSPAQEAEIAGFLQALRETIDACGKRVVLIAAADLAHVGTGFGDDTPPDASAMETVGKADRHNLELAVNRDAEGFFRAIQGNGDCHRICGLAPIYAMLAVLRAERGKLLAYKQCVDPKGFRTVTIASAAYYGPETALA